MPGTSPARAGRDVYERDSDKSGTTCTSRSATVVFPVPDGAEITNRRPRRPGSFDILHLLAHLLELGLQRDDRLGHRRTFRLGTDGVHFAIHLLQQEVQLAAAGLGAVRQRPPVFEVAAKPNDLFGDVRSPNEL